MKVGSARSTQRRPCSTQCRPCSVVHEVPVVKSNLCERSVALTQRRYHKVGQILSKYKSDTKSCFVWGRILSVALQGRRCDFVLRRQQGERQALKEKDGVILIFHVTLQGPRYKFDLDLRGRRWRLFPTLRGRRWRLFPTLRGRR